MTINGRRKFVSNTGKKYMVTDMYKADMERYPGKKYNMCLIEENDRMTICRDSFLDPLKFETIKEAQRYVMMAEVCIEVM